jgi:hypothetical protein
MLAFTNRFPFVRHVVDVGASAYVFVRAGALARELWLTSVERQVLSAADEEAEGEKAGAAATPRAGTPFLCLVRPTQILLL